MKFSDKIVQIATGEYIPVAQSVVPTLIIEEYHVPPTPQFPKHTKRIELRLSYASMVHVPADADPEPFVKRSKELIVNEIITRSTRTQINEAIHLINQYRSDEARTVLERLLEELR